MIAIKDKKDCCGCSACVQICPKQCIRLGVDEEGFEYPSVNTSECVNCGLCERVCPMLNPGASKIPVKVCAAKNQDEGVRARSSSGGVFTPLAEAVIRQNGVVFGAAFDDLWNVRHTYTENEKGLEAFRGSKYVQSKIGESYLQAREFLKQGRMVLFSGTSCQIAGLNRFLGKEYPNLVTLEILCHGVPSPMVWQKYLDQKRKECRCTGIKQISFRDKKSGWSDYNVVLGFENGKVYEKPHRKDPYFRGFLKNLYLRPSCYHCRCKNGRSGSDLVIADYWNIKNVRPDFNDNRGVSLVLIHSEKGNRLFHSVSGNLNVIETGYEECLVNNKGFAEHLSENRKRAAFFKKLKTRHTKRAFLISFSLMRRIKVMLWN